MDKRFARLVEQLKRLNLRIHHRSEQAEAKLGQLNELLRQLGRTGLLAAAGTGGFGEGLKPLAGEVRIWNVATGAKLIRLKGHASAVSALAFSPDGKTLASGSNDETVMLWDVDKLLPRHVER